MSLSEVVPMDTPVTHYNFVVFCRRLGESGANSPHTFYCARAMGAGTLRHLAHLLHARGTQRRKTITTLARFLQ